MFHPATLNPKPSPFLALMAGLVATILQSALIFLAPALGLPLVDIIGLLGGLFTNNPDVALGLGFVLFFIAGLLVFPLILVFYWSSLPGPNINFGGAALKGLILGGGLWFLNGLLLPLLGTFNQLNLENPGFFALNLGLGATIALLVTHLAYGLALGLITAVGQGIEPLEAIGWPGYRRAYTPEIASHFETVIDSQPTRPAE